MISVFTITIYLKTKFIGKSGPRDVETLSTQIKITRTKVFHRLVNSSTRGLAHNCERCRALDLQNPRMRIANRHVIATTMGQEPCLKRPISLHIPKSIFSYLEHNTVHKDATLRSAGNRVIATSLSHFFNLTGQYFL